MSLAQNYSNHEQSHDVCLWFAWMKESHSIYVSSDSCFGIPHHGPSQRFGPGHKGNPRTEGLFLRQIPQYRFVTWKGLWPSLRLLLRPLKTVWVVCTGARAAISLLCLFSKVEVSKLQSKQQLRPSKSLLLKWQWVYLSSNSGIKWKITILWFCFADRSCLLPGPHTELLWAPREGSLATATRDGQ